MSKPMIGEHGTGRENEYREHIGPSVPVKRAHRSAKHSLVRHRAFFGRGVVSCTYGNH
jgi:hypothetical protein